MNITKNENRRRVLRVEDKRNEKLSDEQIVEIIKKYIDEELYNYAIMIDGDWGCGKTHFIKEDLIDKLRKHEEEKSKQQENYTAKRLVYISLYGVKSVVEVSKQVFMDSCLAKTSDSQGVIEKGARVIGSMLPLAFDILKPITGVDGNIDNISKAIRSVVPISDSIFIFDDLERCNCQINEILGYINTFVEQESMKVILVANQKEIGRGTYLENLELKYLVAAHSNIQFEEEQKEVAGLDLIEHRLDRLFGQDILYEKIKEKLIGITIHYTSDLQGVFEKLINNHTIADTLKTYLIEEIPFFEEFMVREEHPNLRTFQFFLSKINDLYNILSQLDHDELESFIKDIIQYCFKVCVCHKNNTFDYSWSGNEEYAFKSMDQSSLYNDQLAFRFVDDFIIKSILDEEKAANMLKVYEEEVIQKKNGNYNSLSELQTMWYLSKEEEVEQKIKEIINELEEDKYELKMFGRIISTLLNLEQFGFPSIHLENAISKMKNNILKSTDDRYIDDGLGLPSDREYKERYKMIIKDLEDTMNHYIHNQVSVMIEQFISEGEGWAVRLEEYVRENAREIKNQNGFLSQIGGDVLVEKIRNSTANDINSFRGCILVLYVNGSAGEATRNERSFLDNFLKKIEAMDNLKLDKVQKVQVKFLINNLQAAQAQYT